MDGNSHVPKTRRLGDRGGREKRLKIRAEISRGRRRVREERNERSGCRPKKPPSGTAVSDGFRFPGSLPSDTDGPVRAPLRRTHIPDRRRTIGGGATLAEIKGNPPPPRSSAPRLTLRSSHPPVSRRSVGRALNAARHPYAPARPSTREHNNRRDRLDGPSDVPHARTYAARHVDRRRDPSSAGTAHTGCLPPETRPDGMARFHRVRPAVACPGRPPTLGSSEAGRSER